MNNNPKISTSDSNQADFYLGGDGVKFTDYLLTMAIAKTKRSCRNTIHQNRKAAAPHALIC